MALDPKERERVRYHMGYLSVQPAASLTFGLPVSIQTLFLVELAMDKLMDEALDRVRRFLQILDKIECQMLAGQEYLIADKLDDISIRADYIDKLEDEYSRWASRLSDELGTPLYPGSSKFRKLFRNANAGVVPVRSM